MVVPVGKEAAPVRRGFRVALNVVGGKDVIEVGSNSNVIGGQVLLVHGRVCPLEEVAVDKQEVDLGPFVSSGPGVSGLRVFIDYKPVCGSIGIEISMEKFPVPIVWSNTGVRE